MYTVEPVLPSKLKHHDFDGKVMQLQWRGSVRQCAVVRSWFGQTRLNRPNALNSATVSSIIMNFADDQLHFSHTYQDTQFLVNIQLKIYLICSINV